MNSPIPSSSAILATALQALATANHHRPGDEATAELTQIEELILVRARLLARLRLATQGNDVVASTLLADQLRACVVDVEARLNAHADRALSLLQRSA